MLLDQEVSKASFIRSVAIAKRLAIVAAIINLPFLILAVCGQVWLRVILIGISEAGFLLAIYYCNPSRYRGYTPWLVLTACWFAVINAVITNGAGMGHVTLFWLSFLICAAGLIGSYRFCISWAVIGFASVICVFMLEQLGIALPNLTPDSQRYWLLTLHTFAQVLAFTAMVTAYKGTLSGFEQQVHQILGNLRSEVVQREKAEAIALKAARDKDQFLRNLSHEFRTPLNSIIGFSDRLLKRAGNGDGADSHIKALDAINRNGKNLHYFVSELLLLDAIQATPLDKHKIQMNELVGSVIEAHKDLAKTYNIEFNLSVDEICLERWLEVDIARLTQAVSNLVLFCVRQSGSGAITIKINDLNGQTSVTFTDCAKSLSFEEHQNLFETHYDYVLANDKDIPCSAFALKIAALIIECHGGRVSSGPVNNGNGLGNFLSFVI